MSSESDSDIFFDAEDSTPVRVKSVDLTDKTKDKDECVANESIKENVMKLPQLNMNEEDLKEAYRKAKDNEQRRQKVEELRKQMLNDDEEVLEIHSEQSSLASSSVEGIYPKSNSNYILKTKEMNNETSSVMSLGKVGSILGERDVLSKKDVDSISLDSKYSMSESESIRDFAVPALPNSKGCEPDVVASTKGEQVQHPVAPPRKKKRNKNLQAATNSSSIKSSNSQLPSPHDPVESITRELEYSLDLHSATQGQYVVKPQDREQDRAEGPNGDNSAQSSVLSRSESLNSVSSKGSQDTLDVHDSLKSPEECKQQPYMVRTRSDSGRPLTDQEILAQVTVRNLDTGEQIPLSLAEEHLPKCLNPLSLHIMRLTSEYVSTTALDKVMDEENSEMRKSDSLDMGSRMLRNVFHGRDLMRRIRVDVSRIRNAVDKGLDKVTHARHAAEDDGSEEENLSDHRTSFKIKVSSKLKSAEKGPSEFENLCVLQELGGEHTGAIWTMKFSCCGHLLATAGQDHDLRIWVLKDAYKYFDDMRRKYNTKGKSSPIPSQSGSCLDEGSKTDEIDDKGPFVSKPFCRYKGHTDEILDVSLSKDENDDKGPFVSKPFCRYKGHTAEILDVSWSKNYFILSSSMDKTVRLWHISRKECLCCFQHIDFVTAIAFHPRDDRYFLSGSLDGKLRLWNIPDKKVTLWNELDGQTKLITALNFCQNGKMAIVGSYDGRCIFYHTDQLKYYTQIFVRSTKGKNAQGRKISGIEAMPGEDKILVTSNDSRIRLYDFRDLSLTCKYKGYLNLSSQIKASFSHDGKYIISGSEDQFIYVWKTSHDCTKFRRDRNDYWTGVKAHNAVVTSAVFAPNPHLILRQIEQEGDGASSSPLEHIVNNYVMVSADFNGTIKVFLHKSKSGITGAS